MDQDIDTIITKLTEPQRDVLGQIATNNDGGHHPRTIAALLKKELIKETESERLPGRFPLWIKHYYTPLHVHIAWCEWCSKNCPIED